MSDNDINPQITVSGGPLIVSGGIPLVRASIKVEDKHSADWEIGAEIDTEEHRKPNGDYWLCRCGESKTKPFCDLTHREIGFDGTPNPPEGTYAERAKAYPGTGVVVHDDRSICEHAGFCAKHRDNVWKMVGRTEDEAVRAEMQSMIHRCPSGALSYRPSEDAEADEPDYPVRIAVVNDSSYWVTGSVPVVVNGETVETRARRTLCRCGHSDIKPLCDGTHEKVGFADR
ncbi:CDGSH iron-sulfur domain-containing protein [Granulicoccus sp. GXG6511]|uniref:CDGSH iron-sulfur domain-containing protein n=1 Tax=Granulicoccus sp. GXG6511 TaxID=3381351 RepID=UPI003D7D40FB